MNPAINELLHLFGPEALSEIMVAFRESLHDFEKTLSTLIHTPDLPGFRKIGHKLKSTFISMGEPEMSKLCEALEQANSHENAVSVAAKCLCRTPEIKERVQRFLKGV
jgi:HPt (histidine-containing phosphotransfer) domain-containing protein